MSTVRDQPYDNDRFAVAIDGMDGDGFSEVTVPAFLDAAESYREGGDRNAAARRLPGRPAFGTLLLKRGFKGSLEFYEWWLAATRGDAAGRRNVVVTLLSESLEPVVRWRLSGAWPLRYWLDPLAAENGGVLYEWAEIACESVEMS